jgi:hypothetical protein
MKEFLRYIATVSIVSISVSIISAVLKIPRQEITSGLAVAAFSMVIRILYKLRNK